MQTNQFGTQRYAVLFKPGTYTADVNLGFYTQVAGLGLSPDDVNLNGHVRVEADWLQQGDNPNNKGNATQNFWRSAENLAVTTPPGQIERWAVSQAAPYRRMHLKGAPEVQLWNGGDGWASGGLFADTQDRRPGRLRLAAAVVLAQLGVRHAGPVRSGTWCSSVSTARRRRTSRTRRTRWSARPRRSARSRSCTSTPPATTTSSSRRCATNSRRHAAGRSGNPAAGHVDRAGRLLRRQAGRVRRHHQRRAGPGQAPAVHAGHLPPERDDPGEPPQHRRAGPRPGHADSRHRAGGDHASPTSTASSSPGLLVDAGPINSPVLIEIGAGRFDGQPRGEPDLAARRVRPRRRRARRQGHGQPARQQQRRDRRPPLAVARRPRRRRRLERQHRRQRTGGQRQQRDHVRPVRRALPGVRDALERQRRPDVLLPERDARTTSPNQAAWSSGGGTAGLGGVQGREHRHHPRGLGRRQLLLLQPQPVDRRVAAPSRYQTPRASASTTWSRSPSAASAPSATSSTTPAAQPTPPPNSATWSTTPSCWCPWLVRYGSARDWPECGGAVAADRSHGVSVRACRHCGRLGCRFLQSGAVRGCRPRRSGRRRRSGS